MYLSYLANEPAIGFFVFHALKRKKTSAACLYFCRKQPAVPYLFAVFKCIISGCLLFRQNFFMFLTDICFLFYPIFFIFLFVIFSLFMSLPILPIVAGKIPRLLAAAQKKTILRNLPQIPQYGPFVSQQRRSPSHVIYTVISGLHI